MYVKKVNGLPLDFDPNCLYMVQRDDHTDYVDLYMSSLDGFSIKKVVGVDDVRTIVSDIYNKEHLGVTIQHDKTALKPSNIDSIPLYTINNSGEYLLCEPDVWLEIDGFVVPAYNKLNFTKQEKVENDNKNITGY